MTLFLIFLLAILLIQLMSVSSEKNSAIDRVKSLESSLASTQKQLAASVQEAEGLNRSLTELLNAQISINSLREEIATRQAQLESVRSALATADELLEDREPIIYPRRYPTENSGQLENRLQGIRERQSVIRKKGQVVVQFGTAVQARLSKEVKTQLKNLVRLARLALEGAADTLLDQVSATNQDRLEKRFMAVVTDINRLLEPWEFEIGKNYQATVRDQLELVAEYKQQVEKEREEQRALREQMREEAAAQREAERAQKEAEKDEMRALKELEKAQAAAQKASAEERDKWSARVAELEAALSAAHAQKDRAVAMAQLTRAGHVYIISNIGSFGDDVFKVGMTRRLDPEDRIKELGDASVPFPFDVHGMIPSQDAPALEAALHSTLDSYRINLVNERKEFFRVPFDVIRSTITSQGLDVKLTLIAEAAEFRQSHAMRQGLALPTFDPIEEPEGQALDDE